MNYYNTALICKNGHVVTSSIESNNNMFTKHCKICGEVTIDRCQNCSTYIHGAYHIGGFMSFSSYELPYYCHECGEPYPWTKLKLDAIEEVINLMDELDEEEKNIFFQSVKDITTDNPKTKVGVMKIRKYGAKIGEAMWSEVRGMLVEIASETAIKAMGLKE